MFSLLEGTDAEQHPLRRQTNKCLLFVVQLGAQDLYRFLFGKCIVPTKSHNFSTKAREHQKEDACKNSSLHLCFQDSSYFAPPSHLTSRALYTYHSKASFSNQKRYLKPQREQFQRTASIPSPYSHGKRATYLIGETIRDQLFSRDPASMKLSRSDCPQSPHILLFASFHLSILTRAAALPTTRQGQFQRK